jgi:mannose-1-phosphate guanylyltransferase/mannose-6-phosphate isomerase
MIATILVGGAGTRLWPASRKRWPKFLLSFGEGRTLLQATYLRLRSAADAGRIFVVTNRDHAFQVWENIRAVAPAFPEGNIVIEPRMCNTLPAIALACRVALRRYGDDVMGVFPGDHYISDVRRFGAAVRRAAAVARRGAVVLFGVKPSRVETGYGYIEAGAPAGHPGVYAIKRFIEKPDVVTAEHLVSAPDVYWNSGMFLFRPSVMLREILEHAPEVSAAMQRWDDRPETLGRIYAKLPSISVDKAVIEKTRNVVFMPFPTAWDDVGSWVSLERLHRADERGNIRLGDHVDIGSRNTIVVGDRRTIATAGLDNVIIADTEDALLVIHRSYAERVREIVQLLGDRGIVAAHAVTPHPWGRCAVLDRRPGLLVSLVTLLPGKAVDIRGRRRSAQWFVVAGRARVRVGASTRTLRVGATLTIPSGTVVRLDNGSPSGPLEIVEIIRGRGLVDNEAMHAE